MANPARRRPAAELLDETVVAATRADGRLRPEPRGHPFEDGAVVVIQPPHQPRVDTIWHACRFDEGEHPLEVRPRLLAKEIQQTRRPLDEFLHRRILRIQDTQRIALEAPFTVLVEFVVAGAEVLDQGPAVRGALLAGTQ